MQKVKVEKKPESNEPIKNKIEYFSKFKQARMVRISGSFMKGGFNISQNKLKAILDNLEMIQKFVGGEYNQKIDELTEDEILKI